MVIRGRTRGGGVQLAKYLLTQGENEDIHILDVAGRLRANDNNLRDALFSMSVTSELTKSEKGLYHAQINPAYGDDRQMSQEDWLKAADLLGEELGLAEQRRVMVLHTKKGRTHGHVVWERFDHEKGKMISDSFSRLAQDRARLAMEQVFEHQPTPHRNVKRPQMKELLTGLWQKLPSGADFIKAAKKSGYIIAAGVQRRPFMVVDDTGRSFDLVRQLDGVKTKEVRERLKGEKLVSEKDAIAQVRKRQQLEERQAKDAVNDNKAKALLSKEQVAGMFAEGRSDITQGEAQVGEQRKKELAEGFAENREDIRLPEEKDGLAGERKKELAARDFADNWGDIKEEQPKQEKPDDEKKKEIAAQEFAVNRGDALLPEESRQKQKRKEFLQSLEDMKQKNRQRDKGREPG